MRVRLAGDATAAQFQSQLLTLGNGQIEANGLISFPPNFCKFDKSILELQNDVFPTFNNILGTMIGCVKEQF